MREKCQYENSNRVIRPLNKYRKRIRRRKAAKSTEAAAEGAEAAAGRFITNSW